MWISAFFFPRFSFKFSFSFLLSRYQEEKEIDLSRVAFYRWPPVSKSGDLITIENTIAPKERASSFFYANLSGIARISGDECRTKGRSGRIDDDDKRYFYRECQTEPIRGRKRRRNSLAERLPLPAGRREGAFSLDAIINKFILYNGIQVLGGKGEAP
jgi:hypothetical protein